MAVGVWAWHWNEFPAAQLPLPFSTLTRPPSRVHTQPLNMGIEDQKEEREVLDSIFPDEITGKSHGQRPTPSDTDVPPDISDTSYRISITLENPTDFHDEDVEPAVILLNVAYPDAYPEVGPNLEITAPPNATKHPLLDVAEDKSMLLEGLQPTVEESLGMAMVFSIVSMLKELAEQLMADRQRQQDQVHETAARKKEEEENRKFYGTKVTKEKFLEWQAKFKEEMAEKARVQREADEADERKKVGAKAAAKADEKRMTGRQLWERGLAGKEVDIEGEDLTDAVKELKVGA